MPAHLLSTYRLQLTPDFGFARAAEVTGYLARLGVTHAYLSPSLQAAPGSTHGYDVVDPSRVSAELGGETGHATLLRTLDAAGLGQVLDIVPNHMAISGRHNRWWWDVLENGRRSRFARYFDITWDPPEPRLRNLVLAPILADHYGRVLERGELRLEWDPEAGELCLRYQEHELPLAPESLEVVLEPAAQACCSEGLHALAAECVLLGSADDIGVERRHVRKESIKRRLAEMAARDQAVRAAVEGVALAVSRDADRLDALLERQHYRLARWQVASQELDYRRFFDIDTLVGMRVEDDEVFEATHGLVLEWVARGFVDGLRVDHVDGLRDPERYLGRLRERAPRSWTVVEKILAADERLPESWPVAGTTGYDFMNRVLRLHVDPGGQPALTDLYREFTGRDSSWADVAFQSKLRLLDGSLATDVSRLAGALLRVCERHRAFRDYTRQEVHEAVLMMLACMPVYRTYVRPQTGEVREEDRAHVVAAREQAGARAPHLDPELLDFITGVLLLRHRGDVEADFVERFQQTCSPVTAKGIEDTAFYNHNLLVCLNDVGGDPDVFSVDLREFHDACESSRRRAPTGMVTTSTHDGKRSEDVRARIALLSEIPHAWGAAVRRWSERNERHRRDGLPDRNAEYLLYQVLVGAHPLPPERALPYMEKATREAKAHTSWTEPDAAYDEAVRGFVEGALGDAGFTEDLDVFVAPLLLPGWTASLSMKLVALTTPGVPDVYQGTELWDLSLVDPDNRRPVDFERRAALLEEVIAGIDPAQAWSRVAEGLPKLLVVHRALSLRRRLPEVFLSGAYEPLHVEGSRAANLIAFARGERAVTLAPRLVIGLGGDWGDTVVTLPKGGWYDELSGRELVGGDVPVRTILDPLPVALLSR